METMSLFLGERNPNRETDRGAGLLSVARLCGLGSKTILGYPSIHSPIGFVHVCLIGIGTFRM